MRRLIHTPNYSVHNLRLLGIVSSAAVIADPYFFWCFPPFFF
jgi:hypothetical protein